MQKSNMMQTFDRMMIATLNDRCQLKQKTLNKISSILQNAGSLNECRQLIEKELLKLQTQELSAIKHLNAMAEAANKGDDE